MKAFLLLLIPVLLIAEKVCAQDEPLSKDAIYDRPFITIGSSATAVGGYLEGNTNYFAEDGVSEGFSMELRRFNMFLYSNIGSRIRFLSELEFEHGAREINLETALLDVIIDPALVLRGGILLPPLGAFNQNHDSPKWDFVERPLVSTKLIPSTYSDIGFGIHGVFAFSTMRLGYEAYAINGLGSEILLNEEGRTFIPAGKHEELFGHDNNASPAWVGKISLQEKTLGEFGLSAYTGAYNVFEIEGTPVDEKRSLTILAADLHTEFSEVSLRGEGAFATLEQPASTSELFGDSQWGLFIEAGYPLFIGRLLDFKEVSVSSHVRFEYVDFNVGTFSSTGEKRFDDITALAGSISVRPVSTVVLRMNYRYHWIRDILGNASNRAGFQFGFAAYF